MFLKNILNSALVCAALAVTPMVASAVTISFDGANNGTSTPLVRGEYQFDVARIVSGPCGANKPCLAFNKHETTTMTRLDGGKFTLRSIWFYLNGKASKQDGLNDLVVTSAGPAASIRLGQPNFGEYDHNKGYTVLFRDLFEDVTSITFSSYLGQGNARVDDIVVDASIPAVPLPAGAGLLAAALASFGLLRRKSKIV
jgi:hypothetical protein